MLIYAEAHTHTAGFDSQTQAALNELRDRCGMPDVPTSLSKEEGLELIANERRIELAAEGFRSDDMYRYSCLLYTSPSPRDRTRSRMPSSA